MSARIKLFSDNLWTENDSKQRLPPFLTSLLYYNTVQGTVNRLTSYLTFKNAIERYIGYDSIEFLFVFRFSGEFLQRYACLDIRDSSRTALESTRQSHWTNAHFISFDAGIKPFQAPHSLDNFPYLIFLFHSVDYGSLQHINKLDIFR